MWPDEGPHSHVAALGLNRVFLFNYRALTMTSCLSKPNQHNLRDLEPLECGDDSIDLGNSRTHFHRCCQQRIS